jgi:hypothetical protein
MQPEENLDLGDGLHLRVLVRDDAALLAEATSGEQDPALWGPRPAGPYSLRDAQAALSAWIPPREASSPSGSCTVGGCSARSG